MLHKLIIGKVDYEPELGRSQNVQILYDKKNELPSANSTDILKKEFGEELEIGKTFYESNKGKYYFASIPEHLHNSISSKWKFISFEELNDKSFADYEIIVKAIKRLGYKTSRREGARLRSLSAFGGRTRYADSTHQKSPKSK